MTEVTVTEFKANCSKLIEQIRGTHQPIRITRFGKHLADIVPVPDEPQVDRASLFGSMEGSIKIIGDIISPASDEDDWECLRDWNSQGNTL